MHDNNKQHTTHTERDNKPPTHESEKVSPQFQLHCLTVLCFMKASINNRAGLVQKTKTFIYLRFSGVKALFRSVSMYLLHFSTALGLLMNGLISSPFLSISAEFWIHIFTSVMPDISFPCVPPKIATRLASCKQETLVRELIARATRTRGLRKTRAQSFHTAVVSSSRRCDVTAVI